MDAFRQEPGDADLQDAFVALQKAAGQLSREVADLLRPAGLTPPQYNVLRILRGARGAALTCGEIGERLITRVPDVTRLLDRLERRGLVHRSRSSSDRRVATVEITSSGVATLAPLDAAMAALHRRQFERLSADDRDRLVSLLAGVGAIRG